jgi:hypothetical protein
LRLRWFTLAWLCVLFRGRFLVFRGFRSDSFIRWLIASIFRFCFANRRSKSCTFLIKSVLRASSCRKPIRARMMSKLTSIAQRIWVGLMDFSDARRIACINLVIRFPIANLLQARNRPPDLIGSTPSAWLVFSRLGENGRP